MNENVRAAIIGLDEAEALLTIEPFHDSGSHVISPTMFHKVGPHARGRIDRCLEEVVSGFVSKASPSRQAENRWAKDRDLRSSLQWRDAHFAHPSWSAIGAASPR
jgi:hypothetical protein